MKSKIRLEAGALPHGPHGRCVSEDTPSRAKRPGACVVGAIAMTVVAGCSAPTSQPVGAFVGAGAGPLVLPAASDPAQAEEMELALARYDGRLDWTLGAPAPMLGDSDVTFTTILDQQFTWNGRVYDSYTNTRRTWRRSGS
ncbi:MAG: hypothetical protein KF724_06750 [Phycisphaeraceae bacterium]|nr:hypothetical protein [Phycisphaeraceae bacterium]